MAALSVNIRKKWKLQNSRREVDSEGQRLLGGQTEADERRASRLISVEMRYIEVSTAYTHKPPPMPPIRCRRKKLRFALRDPYPGLLAKGRTSRMMYCMVPSVVNWRRMFEKTEAVEGSRAPHRVYGFADHDHQIPC